MKEILKKSLRNLKSEVLKFRTEIDKKPGKM